MQTHKRWRLAVLLVAGGLLAYLTFSLGQWQTRRGDEKAALDAQRQKALEMAAITPATATVDTQANLYRKVNLQGRYLGERWVLLDNRQWNGRPAVQWISAFEVKPGGYVVAVDRGLILRNPADPRALPTLPIGTDDGALVQIEGRLQSHFNRAAELWGLRVAGSDEIHRDGRLWSNYDPAIFAKDMNLPLANYVVQVTAEKGIQYAKGQEPHRSELKLSSDVDKHRGYAFQWYSLTIVLIVLTLWLGWRDTKESETNRN